MDSLFSSRWYRVAGIHPRLRSHVRVSRHVYRGQVWYLLQDTSTGRHHRVDENTFHFIGRMDGQRSTDEIWHSLLNKLGENTPTQDETIEILCQLSDNDLLQCEITPNVAELFRRRFEKNRKRRIAMLNPLAFRVTLFDPDKLLERLAPLSRALVHPAALAAWVVVVLLGLLSVGTNWAPIRAFASIHMLTPEFLLIMWILYPLVKSRPRAGTRAGGEGLGRGGARDRREPVAAGAGALRRRVGGLGVPGEVPARAGRERRGSWSSCSWQRWLCSSG